MSKIFEKLKGITQSIMLIILTWWIGGWIIILLIISWRQDIDLGLHVVKTQGTIIELHPEHHNTFIYEFDVAGINYKGNGYGADKVSASHLVRVIYYDSRNPSNSKLENPTVEAQYILTTISRIVLFCLVSSACLLLKIAIQKWCENRKGTIKVL